MMMNRRIATGMWGNNVAVFALNQNNQPYEWSQSGFNEWNYFSQIPNQPAYSQIITGQSKPQGLLLLGLGATDNMPYATQMEPSPQPVKALPGVALSQIVSGQGYQDNLYIIGLGATNNLPYVIWQDSTSEVWSANQQPLTTISFNPYVPLVAGVDPLNNLQIIGLGALDNLPYMLFQDFNTGQWTFRPLLFGQQPPPLRYLAIGAGMSSLLHVVGLTAADNLPYWMSQDTGGTWYNRGLLENSIPLNQVISGIGYPNKNLNFVCEGFDGNLYTISQSTLTTWNPITQIPTNNLIFDQVATGTELGYLQVFGLPQISSVPVESMQAPPAGDWLYGGPLPTTNEAETSARKAKMS